MSINGYLHIFLGGGGYTFGGTTHAAGLHIWRDYTFDGENGLIHARDETYRINVL